MYYLSEDSITDDEAVGQRHQSEGKSNGYREQHAQLHAWTTHIQNWLERQHAWSVERLTQLEHRQATLRQQQTELKIALAVRSVGATSRQEMIVPFMKSHPLQAHSVVQGSAKRDEKSAPTHYNDV
jgi:hypothetical protein